VAVRQVVAVRQALAAQPVAVGTLARLAAVLAVRRPTTHVPPMVIRAA
jgi:hypothetical protein